MRTILLTTAIILFTARIQAADPGYLYRAKFAQAAWDLFTLGVYRDLKHYAESADI